MGEGGSDGREEKETEREGRRKGRGRRRRKGQNLEIAFSAMVMLG